MTTKYLCIHGHFYQPPRENPWLEEIELQETAKPYHDWNARIASECYGPNRASRILDEEGKIIDIVNNYASISFNFGPTLLAWLEKHSKRTYLKILEADGESQKRFSGHGSAMGQVYSHMIMPLANERDKKTQVLWGIADFEHRFKRKPQGMWLAETAVDIPTLEALADQGIIFTILAPHQAKRVRKRVKGGRWHDVSNGSIDPKQSYHCNLPSGKSIALFFYDGPVSREVAFERILSDGELFAKRLTSLFADKPDPQVVHIAADGETYGHHFQFGDMALAYALQSIEQNPDIAITNYSEFLDRFPPTQEVEIIENTSWSCSHGIERWKGNCGCHILGKPGWNQEWRGPLREALNWLRDQCIGRFESRAANFLKDPWQARDLYIQIILHRTDKAWEEFLYFNAPRVLSEQEQVEVLKLLELERNVLLMYTSCGWFFDEISGIETVQILKYAARAIELIKEVLGEDLEPGFIEIIKKAKSNVTEFSDGAWIYHHMAKVATVDLAKVAAHYAMSSIFQEYPQSAEIFSYVVTQDEYRVVPSGRRKLALGKVKVTSRITRESQTFAVCFTYSGDYNVSGGVCIFEDEIQYAKLSEEIQGIFGSGDYREITKTLEKYFHSKIISINYLFADERAKIIRHIMKEARETGSHIASEDIGFLITSKLSDIYKILRKSPEDLKTLSNLMELVLLGKNLDVNINLWGTQNAFFEIMKKTMPEVERRGNENDQEWMSTMKKLGKLLHVRMD